MNTASTYLRKELGCPSMSLYVIPYDLVPDRYSASKNRSSVLNFLIVLEITQELERVRI